MSLAPHQTILLTFADGYYALDREWRFIEMTAAAEEHFGRKAHELIGQDIWHETATPFESPIYQQFHQAVGSGQAIRFEAASRVHPGRWYDLHLHPRHDGGLDVYFKDVTEQRRTREALSESEIALQRERKFLRTVIDSLSSLVMVRDREGRCVLANQAAAAFHGMTVSTLEGSYACDIPTLAANCIAQDQEVLRNRKEIVTEIDVIAADGQLHSLIASKVPLTDADGSSEGVLEASTDVTWRRRSEKALRRSEETFSKAFHCNTSAMAITRVSDGLYLDVNDRFAEVTGLGNVVGQTIRQLNVWKEPADRDAFIRDLLEHGVVRNMECRFQRSNGEEWTGLVSAQLSQIEGEPVVISSFSDITERKRAERSLRESEERLRFHAENSPLAVIEWDRNFVVTRWAGQAERMFGWTADETIGKCFTDLGMVHDADAETVGNVLLRLSDGVSRDVVSSNRNLTKDGRDIECTWYNSVLYGADGRMESVLSLVLDVTDQKRAEEALRENAVVLRHQAEELKIILDALPAAVFIARDPDARTMEGNRFTEEMLRLPRHSNVSKSAPQGEQPTTFRAFKNGVEVPADALPVQIAARTGQEIRDYEFALVYDDGMQVTLLGNAAPFADEQGHVRGAVGAFVDITALKHAEETLNRVNAALAEADRRKDEFIAILSHELRNPLAPIRYALPLLQRQKLDEAGSRAAAVINRQVDHLARLVDDLLDVSRITRGKIDLRRELVTLSCVLTAAAEAASPAVVAARHKLNIVVPDEPIWLHADPARIAQVVTNLLNNSAKYTRRGGEIALEAGREAAHAVIRVRDNGIGIPPEALPAVFDMFRQVNRPDRSQGGLGIGLALAKRLVEMHGGTIEAHSSGAGNGTEFVVRLPIAEAAPNGDVDRATAITETGRRLRVLVVDDNADLVEMLALAVETAGHDVRKALEGRSAVSAAIAFRPHVVLLDLGLPVMSGLDVARELRRRPELHGVRLIALTGWGQAEDRRQTRDAGFDHHLTKPTDPDVLQELLATIANQIAAGE